MDRLAKDLLQERAVPVELPTREVVGFKDGFVKIPDARFPVDKLTIIRTQTNSKNSVSVVFFDEKSETEKAIIVPNEFLFRTPDNETTKQLLDKYRAWAVKNLSGQLAYSAWGNKIGSDPEIFVEDENGQILPAFAFLGSKEKPTLAKEFGVRKQNAIYWDGFQAEFDTDANTCMGWHSDSLHYGLKGLYQAMIKHNPKAKLSAKTVFDIPIELLQKSAREHVAFGCHPSKNAYGMKGLEAPGEEVLYRSAGGHIHFGTSVNDEKVIQRIVKALDAIVGVSCVSLFANYDDPRRRQMYGLAGEYRTPPHGIEYRVLSNAWLFHPLIANIIFDFARSAGTFGFKDFMKYWACPESETIRIINECDVPAARAVMDKNKEIILQVINTRYNNMEMAYLVYDILRNGMETVIIDPTAIADNWLLKPDQRWVTHCGEMGKSVASASVQKNKV